MKVNCCSMNQNIKYPNNAWRLLFHLTFSYNLQLSMCFMFDVLSELTFQNSEASPFIPLTVTWFI